jgi:hypothetical protein
LSVVIMLHPTQSFSACYVTGATAHFLARLQQLVFKSLMVSFLMIMSQIRRHRILQWFLPEEDYPLQTSLLDGPHEAFEI